jgi:CheY-like chemotaxis protein
MRRLLAFARRQPLQPQLVRANELVSGIVKLLRRMLGERVRIELSLAADLWTVTVDPAQLEAAITNLATNARDAMPNGGLLAIATRNVSLDEAYVAAQPDLRAGDFVVIEVADSGTGMAADIVSQIFEPFFSTKEEGKGSGLGLSMVFGFIKQSGGHVTVYSEPGHGSSFKIYLPRTAGDASFEDNQAADPVPRGRAEMILVVEDNEAMRSVVVKQLGSLGYRVVEAENAMQALDIIASDRPIDLLFTDIIMAGAMDGFALAEEAVRRWPDLKVLLTSGFPEKRLGVEAITGVERRLLSKPYRKDELARALREILDGLLP